jgi:hypothetical protein
MTAAPPVDVTTAGVTAPMTAAPPADAMTVVRGGMTDRVVARDAPRTASASAAAV